jgi:outer membrane protein assembly factor BamB
MPHSEIIYLGIKGSVIAVDAATGQQRWATHLKGQEFVNVVFDGDNLYAATRGEIFCLDPKSGERRWHNPLKSFGWGLVSIATESVLPNALLALISETRRRQAQAAASSSAAASGS